jgi:hypothetical protein
LYHQEDLTDWYNIPLRRYALQQKDLANASINPESEQYLQLRGPQGLENLTKASGNVPVFASFPHFCNSDPRLSANIQGLNPQNSKHLTYLDIEPNSGLLARAAKRLQLNYQLQNSTFTSIDEDAPESWTYFCNNLTEFSKNSNIHLGDSAGCDTKPDFYTCMAQDYNWNFYTTMGAAGGWGVYFPTAWADEWLVMDENTANSIKNSLFLLDDLADYIEMWSLIISGLCAMCIFVLLIADETDTDLPYLRASRGGRDEKLRKLLLDVDEEFMRRSDA